MSNINETWEGRSDGKKKQNGMTIWVKGQV